MQPQIIDINYTIANIDEMLRRLIGEHIIISMRLADDIGTVFADRGQIEQVIINLAVNAATQWKVAVH
ncbi:MAG: hypothetical protein R2867_05415 [Caldilineaceae bacterium]